MKCKTHKKRKYIIIIINCCIQQAGIETVSRLVPVKLLSQTYFCSVTTYFGPNKYLVLEYLFIHGCHNQMCLKFP